MMVYQGDELWLNSGGFAPKQNSFPLGSGIHLKTRKWHKSDVQRESVVAFRVPTKASGHWLQKSEDNLNQMGKIDPKEWKSTRNELSYTIPTAYYQIAKNNHRASCCTFTSVWLCLTHFQVPTSPMNRLPHHMIQSMIRTLLHQAWICGGLSKAGKGVLPKNDVERSWPCAWGVIRWKSRWRPEPRGFLNYVCLCRKGWNPLWNRNQVWGDLYKKWEVQGFLNSLPWGSCEWLVYKSSIS